MADFVISIVAVVVVLGIMILVHEWGHFIVAKLMGVRVDVFSIGFGPRLWGWRRGPTDYRLSALPLGGYVKMAGDNPAEERAGRPDEFLSKPRWQRVLIVLAGPTMNIVMAVVLVALLFTVATPQPAYFSQPARIVAVAKDSPAEKAGIRVGDLVVEMNGVKNPTWERAEMELQTVAPGTELSVVLDRGGELVPVAVRTKPLQRACEQYALIGFPPDPVVVGQVASGTPAERSGIRRDDQIVAVNGEPLLSWCQFVDAVQESAGHPMDLRIVRGDHELNLRVRAVPITSRGVTRYQVGLSYRPNLVYISLPLTEAVRRAALFNYRLTQQIVSLVGDLFSGKASLKQLEGPLGIARESGRAARRGLVDLVNLMAVISLNLGILNLLPIPILDGGHILMLSVESLLRRDLSVTIKERFVTVGLVFLLVIIAIVTYNDVLRVFLSK